MRLATLLRGGALALVLAGSASSSEPSAPHPSHQKSSAADARFFSLTDTGIRIASAAVRDHAFSITHVDAEKQIPPCGTTLPSTSRVVKLRIDGKFDVKDTKHNAVSKNLSGGGNRQVPIPLPLNPDSTTYDLLLDSTDWGTDNVIALRIMLKDDDLTFIDNDEWTITTVDTPNKNMFICLEKLHKSEDIPDNENENNQHGGKTYPYATIYLDRTVKGWQKFNIRVVAKHKSGNYVLPLIIDPNIKNNG